MQRESLVLVHRDPEDGKVKPSPLYDRLAALIREHDIGLVVIDPLVEAYVGMDENSNGDMKELVVTLRRLARARDIPLLVIHHSRKGASGGDQDGARGGSALVNACRVVVTLDRMSDDEHRRIKAAQSAMERALAAADRATSAIDGRVRDLGTAIATAVQPRVDPTLAAEVRDYWRERGWTDGMTEAIRADVRTASAILSGPGYLSGLDPDQFATMRRIAVDAHAAEQQAALDEALRARRKVETAGGRMMQLVAPRLKAWSEPESESLSRLEALGRG